MRNDDLTLIKKYNELEINHIRESCKIVHNTLNLVEKNIAPGIKLSELDKLAEEYILSQGGNPSCKGYKGFPNSICTSVDNVVVHGFADDTILEAGQIITIDCVVDKNGFYGDAAKTFIIGYVDKKITDIVKITNEALNLAIMTVEPGKRFGDIGYAIQTFIESYGYSVIKEFCGHGIGKRIHESPLVLNFGKQNTGAVIENGMVFTIEPISCLGKNQLSINGWHVKTKDGSVAAHFEHTLAIFNDKTEILT